MLGELVFGVRIEAHGAIAQPLAVLLNEMPCQRKNVARPLAQRGQRQMHHVQPVEQVFAEMAGGHCVLQPHVGRGHHAHVDRHALARAQAHHFSLLQHAQQLHLDRQWQVADLIEEERAAVGCLEPSSLGRERAGKGAFLMAEELALDQALGEGAAVHGHEGPAAAAAEVVHMPRDQLLAGAGLSDDEYVGVAGRHHADAFEQCGRARVLEHLGGGADRGGELARVGQREQCGRRGGIPVLVRCGGGRIGRRRHSERAGVGGHE
ncbi:hypothetical protein D3C85_819310 [compost metagenome]